MLLKIDVGLLKLGMSVCKPRQCGGLDFDRWRWFLWRSLWSLVLLDGTARKCGGLWMQSRPLKCVILYALLSEERTCWDGLLIGEGYSQSRELIGYQMKADFWDQGFRSGMPCGRRDSFGVTFVWWPLRDCSSYFCSLRLSSCYLVWGASVGFHSSSVAPPVTPPRRPVDSPPTSTPLPRRAHPTAALPMWPRSAHQATWVFFWDSLSLSFSFPSLDWSLCNWL